MIFSRKSIKHPICLKNLGRHWIEHFDGAQERLALALYAAYWDEGADIGDDESLVALAAAAGLDAENARQDLKNPKSIAEIKSEAEAFRQAGVTGVPTFIVNERTGFAGALPPARLAETLREAAAATRVQ